MPRNSSFRLFIIIGSLDQGGCETHLLQLLPSLQAKNIEIRVFLLSRSGSLAPKFEAAGIRLITPLFTLPDSTRFPKFRKIFALPIVLLHLLFSLLKERPQIVHFFLPASYWIGAPITFFLPKIRRVMSRRSLNNYLNGKPFFQKFEAFLHKRMHRILGNSKAVVLQLLEEGAPENKTSVIYNGVVLRNTKVDFLALRKEFGLQEGIVVLTIVANLIPYKGHRELIDALAIVASQSDVNWVLLVVGRDDGIGNNLRRYADSKGISDKIRFLGQRSDVAEIYSISDIAMLISHHEGFSNAILEGMAAGLPMIVTDAGGNSEAVLNKENGLVVPIKDSQALAEAIETLLHNPKLRKKMGIVSKELLAEKFTLENCVDQYLSVYSHILSKKQRT